MAALRRYPFGSANSSGAGSKAKLDLAGPFDLERRASEAKLFSRVERSLKRQWQAVQRRLRGNAKALDDYINLPDDEAFWSAQKEDFQKVVGSLPENLMLQGVAEAGKLGLEADWSLANDQVGILARDYTDDWWNHLSRTTRNDMRNALQRHVTDGTSVRQLRQELEPLFGSMRADRIAVTEATRLFAEGNAVAYKTAGIQTFEWRTAFDERVCPICTARTGKRYSLHTGELPPAHVKCRCWASPVVGKHAVTRVQA